MGGAFSWKLWCFSLWIQVDCLPGQGKACRSSYQQEEELTKPLTTFVDAFFLLIDFAVVPDRLVILLFLRWRSSIRAFFLLEYPIFFSGV
jgi:hypothetical protein